MNQADVMPAGTDTLNGVALSDLSSEVTELDNPVLSQVSRSESGLVTIDSPAPNREIDAWETVAFPDAIIDVTGLPEGESIDIVTSLEQQNQTLRDRVGYLETSLSTAQDHLHQEVSRWETIALQGDELQAHSQTQAQTIAEYVAELTETQQKVAGLYGQVELGHQTAQRQHIVMETLNTQLRNSQERVAQLERECASVHQQNVDQAQNLLQQAHQVRDLQSRLQRQQRYTLQYKAALEKSLEVPATPPTTPTLLSETTANQLANKQVTMPKPTPVKPWSAPETEADAQSQKAWLNAFLSDSTEFPTENVLTNFDWQPSQNLDQIPVSFNLDELPEDGAIDFDQQQPDDTAGQRFDSWETQPTGASPFITLQANPEDATTDEAPVPAMPKRESLAAVDLPMFSKADAIATK
jgi:hypothetical protein